VGAMLLRQRMIVPCNYMQTRSGKRGTNSSVSHPLLLRDLVTSSEDRDPADNDRDDVDQTTLGLHPQGGGAIITPASASAETIDPSLAAAFSEPSAAPPRSQLPADAAAATINARGTCLRTTALTASNQEPSSSASLPSEHMLARKVARERLRAARSSDLHHRHTLNRLRTPNGVAGFMRMLRLRAYAQAVRRRNGVSFLARSQGVGGEREELDLATEIATQTEAPSERQRMNAVLERDMESLEHLAEADLAYLDMVRTKAGIGATQTAGAFAASEAEQALADSWQQLIKLRLKSQKLQLRQQAQPMTDADMERVEAELMLETTRIASQLQQQLQLLTAAAAAASPSAAAASLATVIRSTATREPFPEAPEAHAPGAPVSALACGLSNNSAAVARSSGSGVSGALVASTAGFCHAAAGIVSDCAWADAIPAGAPSALGAVMSSYADAALPLGRSHLHYAIANRNLHRHMTARLNVRPSNALSSSTRSKVSKTSAAVANANSACNNVAPARFLPGRVSATRSSAASKVGVTAGSRGGVPRGTIDMIGGFRGTRRAPVIAERAPITAAAVQRALAASPDQMAAAMKRAMCKTMQLDGRVQARVIPPWIASSFEETRLQSVAAEVPPSGQQQQQQQRPPPRKHLCASSPSRLSRRGSGGCAILRSDLATFIARPIKRCTVATHAAYAHVAHKEPNRSNGHASSNVERTAPRSSLLRRPQTTDHGAATASSTMPSTPPDGFTLVPLPGDAVGAASPALAAACAMRACASTDISSSAALAAACAMRACASTDIPSGLATLHIAEKSTTVEGRANSAGMGNAKSAGTRTDGFWPSESPDAVQSCSRADETITNSRWTGAVKAEELTVLDQIARCGLEGTTGKRTTGIGIGGSESRLLLGTDCSDGVGTDLSQGVCSSDAPNAVSAVAVLCECKGEGTHLLGTE